MTRLTIGYGIDLGTTNSAIARMTPTGPEIVKNKWSHDLTPSAVWYGANGRREVGYRASERSAADPDNVAFEFKRRMGTSDKIDFPGTGLSLAPEELSAEVLTSLRADVQRRTGEELAAAIVTVPAEFDVPENQATYRAAQLAGLRQVELLQEPIAAALANGMQTQGAEGYWLVYDFGGGTFDAALMRFYDSAIQVVNHGGEKYLGGKNIDLAILDKLVAPALARRLRLPDFERGNPRYRTAFAMLKRAVERAKIELSDLESTALEIESIPGMTDDPFELNLRRAEITPLMDPFINQSVSICRRVLAEKRMSLQDLEKVILVGGPTLTPYFRERLSDRTGGLGIAPIDWTQDPLTVVARGAALFAATVRLAEERRNRSSQAHFDLKLEYSPMGADVDPLVSGVVVARGGTSLAGYTLEFTNKTVRPEWRSPQISLDKSGRFVTNLFAQTGPTNIFAIELKDPTGGICVVDPQQFEYTVGLDIMAPPLNHDIAIALANNQVKVVFEKGTPLPARKTVRGLRSAFKISSDGDRPMFVIPVVEGPNRIQADRNRRIGSLDIAATEVRRPIPQGAPVDVTIEIDRSGQMKVTAELPTLDYDTEVRLSLVKEAKTPQQLHTDAEASLNRLQRLREQSATTGNRKAEDILADLDDQGLVDQVKSLEKVAEHDRDASASLEKTLLNLTQALDQIEGVQEFDLLRAEAEQDLTRTEQIVEADGTHKERERLAILVRETRQAIAQKDIDLLRHKIGQLGELRFSVLRRLPQFWVGFFQYLEAREMQMTDQETAAQLFTKARAAIRNRDFDELKAAVSALRELLPEEEKEEMTRAGYGSTVI